MSWRGAVTRGRPGGLVAVSLWGRVVHCYWKQRWGWVRACQRHVGLGMACAACLFLYKTNTLLDRRLRGALSARGTRWEGANWGRKVQDRTRQTRASNEGCPCKHTRTQQLEKEKKHHSKSSNRKLCNFNP